MANGNLHNIEIKINASANGVSNIIEKVVSQMQQMAATSGNAGNAINGMSQKLEVTAGISEETASAMNALKSALVDAASAFRGASGAANSAANSIGRAGSAANSSSGNINSNTNAVNKNSSAYRGHSTSVMESIGNMVKMSVVGTLVYSSITAVTQAVTDSTTALASYMSTMEQNNIAFESFLGSARAAKYFYQDLVKLAADTPFELPQLTQASKKMLAFGFSAKEVLPMMEAVGNAVAGLGGSAVMIDRVTIAIGQMKAKGRVQGDELLQLAEAGIPAYQILQEKLGLTSKQVANIGREGIKADVAIRALVEGMNERFNGMMEKQSNSMQGMLSTIKDNMLMIGSAMSDGLFNSLKDTATKMRDFTNTITNALRTDTIRETLKSMVPEELYTKIVLIGEKFSEVRIRAREVFSGLYSAVSPVLDNIGRLILSLLPYIISVGNGFLKIAQSILPMVQKAANEVAYAIKVIGDHAQFVIRVLEGFVIIKAITAMTLKLEAAWLAVRKAIVVATAIGTFTSFATGIGQATTMVGKLRAAVLALGVALKNVSRGNIFTVLLAIGLAVAGDKLFEYIDKWTGASNTPSVTEDSYDDFTARQQRAKNDKEELAAREELANHGGRPQHDDGDELDEKKYRDLSKIADAAIAKLKTETEATIAELNSQIITIEQKAKIAGLPVDLAKTEALRVQINQAQVSLAQGALEIIKSQLGAYEGDEKHGGEYDSKIEQWKQDLNKASRELNDTVGNLSDVKAVADALNVSLGKLNITVANSGPPGSGEGKTWYASEADNANTNDLKDSAKSALDAIAAWFNKETGEQLPVTSGYRTWGGHTNGLKFDVAGGAVESMGAEFRARLEQFANSLGITVLNNYAERGDEHQYGNYTPHMDFNTSGYSGGSGQTSSLLNLDPKHFGQQLFEQASRVGTKATEAIEQIRQLLTEAKNIDLEILEQKGDSTTRQKAEIDSKYQPLYDQFTAIGWTEYAKKVANLMQMKKAGVDLEKSLKDLSDAEKDYADDLSKINAGTTNLSDNLAKTDAAQAKHVEEMSKKLEQAMKEAAASGNPDNIRKVKEAMKSLQNQEYDFAVEQLNKVKAQVEEFASKVNNTPGLADFEKQIEINDYNYEHKGELIARNNAAIEKAQALGKWDDVSRLKQYNYELMKTQDYLGQVRSAAREAFANGLEEFFEKGIFECKSLGDAFRNLAISVLQSIQKINAQRLTATLMKQWFPTDDKSGLTDNAVGGYYDGKTMQRHAGGGEIKGEGTGTSDSILSWVSNGEFILRASAVKKYGLGLIHAMNQGVLNPKFLPEFATGGSVGGSKDGLNPLSAIASGGGSRLGVKIFNITDPNEVGRYLSTKDGERVMLNHIKRNAGAYRNILNIKG